MKVKETREEIDDMFLVINDQAIKDDFITTLKWKELDEFIEDLFIINQVSIFKVKVSSRNEYNKCLIAYLRELNRLSARKHFPIKDKVLINKEELLVDSKLEGVLFDVMADGYKIDFKSNEVLMKGNILLSDNIKYLMDVYGFNLKIIKS